MIAASVFVATLLTTIALAPPHPPGQAAHSGSLAPEQTLQQISTLLSRDDFAAAKILVSAALKQHPEDPALHNFAGVIDAQAGESAPAESHFQTAIRLSPRGSAAYENLGRLYQERAAVDPSARSKALATYRRLLAVDPSNVEGLFQAGFLLALAGEFSESRALLDRLPARVAGTPQVMAVLITDFAGVGNGSAASATLAKMTASPILNASDVLAVAPAFERIADDAVLQQMLEALDRRGLGSGAVLQALAALHSRHQRFRDARAVLERAVAIDGANVALLLELARAADKLDDHEGALGYLAHARDLDPANATVHFLFGIVCVELNLGSEAYESLKKAVALAPDQPLVNYAMGARFHAPARTI